MERPILLTGKGGVGKTSLAAAHAVASAGSGKRTLLASMDAAHNLSDLFDCPGTRTHRGGPEPGDHRGGCGACRRGGVHGQGAAPHGQGVWRADARFLHDDLVLTMT